MPVERASGTTSLIDVLDRVLDKGVVIDAWARVSLPGIDLVSDQDRIVVASVDTHLEYPEAAGGGVPAAGRAAGSRAMAERSFRSASPRLGLTTALSSGPTCPGRY